MPIQPRRPPRRRARDLRRLAHACGVAVVSGPGCFLFFPCDSSETHLETETGFDSVLEWFSSPTPGGPFTGSWWSGSTVILVGPDGAVRSLDDGVSWETLAGAPAGLAAVDAGAGEERWMVGADGLAGVWRRYEFSPGNTDTAVDLADVAVYEGSGGVAVGADGTVLTSEDGVTWTVDPKVAALLAVPAPTLHGAEFTSDGNLWVVGDNGLLLHRGTGTWSDVWERVDLGTDADLYAVAFASPTRGMVAGADGTAFWTDDSGRSWVPAPAPGPVHALVYSGPPDDSLRWATGPDGVVWSFDGDAWQETARTPDGSALATLAAWQDLGLAAGAAPETLVYGWVDYGFSRQFEVPDCVPYVGRPFLVDGVLRVAQVFPDHPEKADPRWLRQAQEEHSSIAAFVRFARQLRALGAPAALVAEAVAAQADEARHAALALEMAGGGTLGALALACPQTADAFGPDSLVDVAVANAREGCIVETAAVFAAMESARTAATLEERRVWRTIVRDETRHVALAWRFLRWAIGQDPAVSRAVTPIFAARPASVPAVVWHTVILPALQAAHAPQPAPQPAPSMPPTIASTSCSNRA